jgi:Arc/MetJ-type ribon-helix-helix transcriptional regulator
LAEVFGVEVVSLRLGPEISKQIEKDMKDFKYSTKTEFIREAVRDKLKAHDKERAWKALFAARGAFKGKAPEMTDEEWRKRREEAGEEFIELLEKKFSQK